MTNIRAQTLSTEQNLALFMDKSSHQRHPIDHIFSTDLSIEKGVEHDKEMNETFLDLYSISYQSKSTFKVVKMIHLFSRLSKACMKPVICHSNRTISKLDLL